MQYTPGQPLTVAVFRRTGEYTYDTLSSPDQETNKNFVRLTEYMAIDFAARESNQVVGEQVQSINDQIAEATEEFTQKITRFNIAKAELLALTHEEVGDDISF